MRAAATTKKIQGANTASCGVQLRKVVEYITVFA